jgi:hypothetical protein
VIIAKKLGNVVSKLIPDKHQVARDGRTKAWEPILTDAKLKEALAEKAELKLMATELERKLLRFRARRLEK